jgi:hypothetical protein
MRSFDLLRALGASAVKIAFTGNGSPKRKGHPATGRPFLSRENSSNKLELIRTFWRNLMSLKRWVSSKI